MDQKSNKNNNPKIKPQIFAADKQPKASERRLRQLDVADVETPEIRAYAEKTKRIDMALRILLLLAGMFVAAFGISLIAVLNLGSTPISSLPLVVAAITGLSFGTTTFIVNLFFVLGQNRAFAAKISTLGTCFRFRPFLVFSIFIDLSMHLLSGVTGFGYVTALALSLVGNLLLAFGIVMQIRSKTLVQPGEGIVLAVAVTLKKPFGYMKICNDVSLVATAAVVSWCVLGEIVQIREGTLLSAVLVGLLVKAIDGLRRRITGKDLAGLARKIQLLTQSLRASSALPEIRKFAARLGHKLIFVSLRFIQRKEINFSIRLITLRQVERLAVGLALDVEEPENGRVEVLMRGVLLRAFGKRRAVDAVGSRKRVGEPHHHRNLKLFVRSHHVGGAVQEEPFLPEAFTVVGHPEHPGIDALFFCGFSEHADRVSEHRIRFDHTVVVSVANIFDGAARKVCGRAFGAKDLALVRRTFEISGTVRAIHMEEQNRR